MKTTLTATERKNAFAHADYALMHLCLLENRDCDNPDPSEYRLYEIVVGDAGVALSDALAKAKCSFRCECDSLPEDCECAFDADEWIEDNMLPITEKTLRADNGAKLIEALQRGDMDY